MFPIFSMIIVLNIFTCVSNDNNNRLLYEESKCSLEYQTIDLNSYDQSSNNQSTMIQYYPRCIRVKRCVGCCSMIGQINFDDYDRRVCRATKIEYRTIVQTSQIIFKAQTSNSLKNFNYNNNKFYDTKLISRPLQIEYHSACQCFCKNNLNMTCQNVRHRFYMDSCRCECDRDKYLPLKYRCMANNNNNNSIKKFWDEKRCECRCQQFHYYYINNYEISNRFRGFSLDDIERQLCVDYLNYYFNHTVCKCMPK